MIREINFDLDGTIADLYGVETWLEDILSSNPRPYEIAKPLVRMNVLARHLNRLQKLGYKVNVISWLAKSSSVEYDELVTRAKREWLAKHLPSVTFNSISIVPYGTPKQTLGQGILFDDEKQNRDNWNGRAYDVQDILGILKGLK